MPLTVLGVGYSLAPVGPDAVGGAEQILSALDRALVEAGHHSIVVGTLGSQVAGTLVPAGRGPHRHHRGRARSGRPAAPASRRAGIGGDSRWMWSTATRSISPIICPKQTCRPW